MPVSARLLICACLVVGGPAAASAQSLPERPTVTPVQTPDSLHVTYVAGDCRITLSAPIGPERQTARFILAYARSDGCRWWPLEREMVGLRSMLAVLLRDIEDRSRIIGLAFGRIVQPAFRIRIANAALVAELSLLSDGPDFRRRLQAALIETQAFRELVEIFDAHGLRLSLDGLEAIERRREVELAELGIDRTEFARPAPPNALIAVGATARFDVKPK